MEAALNCKSEIKKKNGEKLTLLKSEDEGRKHGKNFNTYPRLDKNLYFQFISCHRRSQHRLHPQDRGWGWVGLGEMKEEK